MISDSKLINKTYTLQHARGEQELIVAQDLEELEHITSIYADSGYTVRGELLLEEGKYLAYISNCLFSLGYDKVTVIGFN